MFQVRLGELPLNNSTLPCTGMGIPLHWGIANELSRKWRLRGALKGPCRRRDRLLTLQAKSSQRRGWGRSPTAATGRLCQTIPAAKHLGSAAEVPSCDPTRAHMARGLSLTDFKFLLPNSAPKSLLTLTMNQHALPRSQRLIYCLATFSLIGSGISLVILRAFSQFVLWFFFTSRSLL